MKDMFKRYWRIKFNKINLQIKESDFILKQEEKKYKLLLKKIEIHKNKICIKGNEKDLELIYSRLEKLENKLYDRIDNLKGIK